MMNIKIILLLSLVAYVLCGSNTSSLRENLLKTDENLPETAVNYEEDQVYKGANPDFKRRDLVLNGWTNPGATFGCQDIVIKWYNMNDLEINGKQILGVNGIDGIVIDYHEEGGITVNGQPKEGFQGLKAAGQTVLRMPGKYPPVKLFENSEVTIERNRNGIIIGGEIVPGIGEREDAVVDILVNGGIAVNGIKIKGFDHIKRPKPST
ncbi:uncharacterized protein LOC126833044 isoform X2 [Adelges cooleyi]|uniref:uncharacterized protein LOC126833044 isoform X2 n=1 Tax=Adelges cooleyi TaxID=133065 RepID=UPI00218062D3|nr:uncharacterized protein LOC126833044 isoform X2 [Adelges cooleyi]